MKGKITSILITVVVIAAAVVCVFLLGNDDKGHIADTNGAENFALQSITDENIINRDISSVGFRQSYDSITGTTSYHSERFSGVVEVYGENVTATRMELVVNHAKVTEGNFRLVLMVNDEIVHEFSLNELTQTYVLENAEGYVSLRAAGESANFVFDYYTIP